MEFNIIRENCPFHYVRYNEDNTFADGKYGDHHSNTFLAKFQNCGVTCDELLDRMRIRYKNVLYAYIIETDAIYMLMHSKSRIRYSSFVRPVGEHKLNGEIRVEEPMCIQCALNNLKAKDVPDAVEFGVISDYAGIPMCMREKNTNTKKNVSKSVLLAEWLANREIYTKENIKTLSPSDMNIFRSMIAPLSKNVIDKAFKILDDEKDILGL